MHTAPLEIALIKVCHAMLQSTNAALQIGADRIGLAHAGRGRIFGVNVVSPTNPKKVYSPALRSVGQQPLSVPRGRLCGPNINQFWGERVCEAQTCCKFLAQYVPSILRAGNYSPLAARPQSFALLCSCMHSPSCFPHSAKTIEKEGRRRVALCKRGREGEGGAEILTLRKRAKHSDNGSIQNACHKFCNSFARCRHDAVGSAFLIRV